MVSQFCVCLAIIVQAFLLGSIPWGVVLSKLLYNDDVREHGSGNIGTTNMIRSYGKRVGYVCFVLDFAKAILACVLANVISNAALQAHWISSALYDLNLLVIIAGLCAVLGHIFSPWLKFKGGKGIACGAGVAAVAFGVQWLALLVAAFAFLLFITRTVSAGSLAAAVIFPFVGLYVYWGNPVGIAICFAIGIVVIWSHRSNIQRLLNGTENKIGSAKK